MSMRTRCQVAALTLLASVVVFAAPVSPAGAVDQDLQVSATSGAPGDEITVSSASCVTDQDPIFRYVQFRLVSGTAPDQQVVGVGIGDPDAPVGAIVPDWVDPAEPAVLEATCYSIDFETGAETTFDYDPVTFDVLPGAGSPTQTRTFSRTSLLAGQGFSVSGTGCDLGGDSFPDVIVFPGDDLTGRTWTQPVNNSSGGESSGDEFQADTTMSNGGLEIWVSQEGDKPPVIEELKEVPTDIPAGTYTAVAACEDDDSILLYAPELIEVTGNAPFDADDLTFDKTTRRATVAGDQCTAADGVAASMFADSFADVFADESDFALQRAFPGRNQEGSDGHRFLRSADLRPARLRKAGARRVARDLGAGDFASTVLQPDAAGSWSASQKITFNTGFVEADAVCGDPLADGFVYDPQAAEVTLPPLKVTQTTTTTTPADTAPPAEAVPGNANFAG